MQPEGPEFSPAELPVEAAPAQVLTEPPALLAREPFWGYLDLALMMGLLTASTAVVLLIVGMLVGFNPKLQNDPTPLAVPGHFVMYGLVYLCFWLVIGLRYKQPVLQSLGWRKSRFNLFAAGSGGVVLALGISALAAAVHTPKVPSPIDKLIDTPLSFAVIAFVAVVAAPFFEELFFRGFLQPLFSRTFGTAAGVLVTAILFGALHGPEYSWAWQYAAAITIAGAVFGWVRARSNSVIPSSVMHGCFNAVQVIAFAVLKYSKYKLDI